MTLPIKIHQQRVQCCFSISYVFYFPCALHCGGIHCTSFLVHRREHTVWMKVYKMHVHEWKPVGHRKIIIKIKKTLWNIYIYSNWRSFLLIIYLQRGPSFFPADMFEWLLYCMYWLSSPAWFYSDYIYIITYWHVLSFACNSKAVLLHWGVRREFFNDW